MATESGGAHYPPPFNLADDVSRHRRIVHPLRVDTLRNGPLVGARAPPGLPSNPRSPNHLPATRSPQLPSPHNVDPELFSPIVPQSARTWHVAEATRLEPSVRSPGSSNFSRRADSPSSYGYVDDDPYGFPPRRTAPVRQQQLRTSSSSPRLNNMRSPMPMADKRYHDTTMHGLTLPRFSPSVSSELNRTDELRSSMNSAMTSGSSFDMASGTERSSVLTKSSSIIDLSPDTPGGPDEYYDDDGGMSVEDAISMYLDGFEDDPMEEHAASDLEKVPTTIGPVQLTESATDDDPISNTDIQEPDPLADPSPTTSSTASSVAAVRSRPPSGHEDVPQFIPGVVPPKFLPGDGAHDRYGFRKVTHHVTLDQYEAWNREYSGFATSRKTKWMELLRENGLPTVEPMVFPFKSSKVKRFVRKGIPHEYRGAAWFWYAGGHEHLNQNLGLYDDLVRQAMESPKNDDKEHIERDLHRTFPDNVHFKPESIQGSSSGSSNLKYSSAPVETQMIRSLRRVLYAFALHNPRVGYTQSLNFIAGMLLLFLPEEKAFWMLHIITSVYLPGTHEISLEGANIDLWILMVLLRESLPHLYVKIVSHEGATATTAPTAAPTPTRAKPPPIDVQSRLPDITLGLTNWLMSLFIGSLPLETTLRVWDVFFYEGSKTFFRISLAIFKACESEILRVSDPMEVFQVVQTAPKKLVDANALLEETFTRRRHRFGQGRINTLRGSRRQAVRQEKLRRSIAIGNGQLQLSSATDEWPTRSPKPILPGIERGIAGGWRHMKQHAFR